MILRWIFRILGIDDEPDPAWKPAGYTVKFTGHDEALGVAAVKHSDQLAEARRRMAALRSVPRKAP